MFFVDTCPGNQNSFQPSANCAAITYFRCISLCTPGIAHFGIFNSRCFYWQRYSCLSDFFRDHWRVFWP
ncbi:MAG: gallidermin family lantibiotic [Bacteroidota bacterium]